MPYQDSSQKGFAQILVMLLLLGGLGAAVVLVQQKTNFLPKAFFSRPITTPTPTHVSQPVKCIQVVTAAKNPAGLCQEFPTPCDVPKGWTKVEKCGSSSAPLSCNACNADVNKDGIVNNYDVGKISDCISKKAKGTACLNMDFDRNKKVDQADLKCVRSVYNQKCTNSRR